MHETRRNWMVFADVAGLISIVGALILLHEDMSDGVRVILEVIASGLLLCLRDAHNFEFGSSRGSKEKSDLLAERKPGSTV